MPERVQKRIWEQEHATGEALPSVSSEASSQNPSENVVYFIDYLSKHHAKPPLKVIDLGCGKGRNTIYLAKMGFNVYGVDYIQSALEHTEKVASSLNLSNNVHLLNHALDEPWPYRDNIFDIAIDNFSSIDIETRKGREKYKKEMFRTLKPNGYVLVAVVSIDDKFENELMKQSPGIEPNSSIWPQNGKFQKNYSEDELRKFYNIFKIVELTKVQKKAYKLGKDYTATNFRVILQKVE